MLRREEATSTVASQQNSFFNQRVLHQEHQARLTLVPDSLCPITQESLKDFLQENIFQHIACGNQMQWEALRTWLLKDDTCPLCRSDQPCELILTTSLTSHCTIRKFLPGLEVSAYILYQNTFYYASAVDVPIVEQQLITNNPEQVNLVIELLMEAEEQNYPDSETIHFRLSDNGLRLIREHTGHHHIRTSICEQSQIMGLIPPVREFSGHDYMRWLKFALKNKDDRASLLVLDQMLKMQAFLRQACISDQCGYSPLHYAVRLGKINMVRILLQYGALQSTACYNDGTPAQYAASLLAENQEKYQEYVIFSNIVHRLENTYNFFTDFNDVIQLIALEKHTRLPKRCSQKICRLFDHEMREYARHNDIVWQNEQSRQDFGLCLADLFRHWNSICEHPLITAIRNRNDARSLLNYINKRFFYYQNKIEIYEKIINIFETHPTETQDINQQSRLKLEYLAA